MSDVPTVSVQNPVDAPLSPAKKKGPRCKVVIFGLWCKGCGLCVEFCPTGVLEFDDNDHPVVAHPEKCTCCHWCDTHCPDLAIVVKPIV